MADAFAELPAALAAIFDSLEFEDDGWISLRAFRKDGGGCDLDLAVRTGVEDDPPQCWRFAFATCVEHRLAGSRRNGAWSILWLHAPPHVLLEPWTEPHATLWFSGATSEPARVAEALRSRHAQHTAGFAGLPECLNGNVPLAELLAWRVGQLAHGPAPLLRGYAEVLGAHGVEFTLREGRANPEYGGKGYDDPSALRALTWGESYVIGTGLRAERVDQVA